MMYKLESGISYRFGKEGDEMLANFTASIIRETSYLGGAAPEKTLTLIGERVNPDWRAGQGDDEKTIKLPEITITDSEFAGMAWPLKFWGVACVILPGSGIKEDLRTAIQLLSRPAKTSIYKQTGWVTLENGKRAYLHRDGAITAKGNDRSVQVQLPPELRYSLLCEAKPIESIRATLSLTTLGPPDLTWPLLAATLAPLYGAVDYAVHVTGRTGSFKSEVLSLFQSHYGPEMDARHLPGSWSSSENALEAMAFLACNAAFTIDDFVPHGSSWQQRAYQGKAERIFRAQGNQAGRQRLTDVSSVQQTMYPRGCVLSTGEDTPEGHSVRGRMMIREVQAGVIEADKLTKAQGNRPLYCGTVAWLAQQFAAEGVPDLKPRASLMRDELREIGHGRTPSMLGQMIAVLEDFLERCRVAKFVSEKFARDAMGQAMNAIIEAGKEQNAFLEQTDPVEVFITTLRQMFAAGTAHIRSTSGGIPKHAELMGWTSEANVDGVKQYKARGACIGWASAKKDELYLEPTACITLVKKVGGAEIPLSKQTLIKRINEGGKLVRTDSARGRLACRVTCEDSPRQVLVMRLTDTLDMSNEVTEED
jgi:hypothetical protein